MGNHHSLSAQVARRLLCLCCLLLSLAAIAAHADPVSLATVLTAQGHISIQRHGRLAPVALTASEVVYAGDVIKTGPDGKVGLLYGDGSQVKLGPNSSIAISPPQLIKGKTSIFRALIGEIWARFRPGDAAQTEYSNLVVRGTEVNLQVDSDGTTTLTVFEGTVDFFNDHGEVLVNASQQSVIRPGAGPTAPLTVGNPDLIIEWTLDLYRTRLPLEKFYITLDRHALAPILEQRRRQAETAPQDAQAQLDYGDALFDSHLYEAALERYQAADRATPHRTETWTRIGYALIELHRLDEAELILGPTLPGSLERATANTVASVATPHQAHLSTIDWRPTANPAASNRLAAADEPVDRPYVPAVVAWAWIALERDRPAVAERVAALAVQTDPDSAAAQLVYGVALLRQPTKFDAAAAAFAAAAKAHPEALRYQAHAWLALLLLARDNGPAARAEADKAVELAPDSSLAHANLATVAFFAGDTDTAENEANHAVRLDPDSVASTLALGEAQLAQGDASAAARTAARAVALDPKSAQAQYLLGVADAQQRDYTHAERELRRANELSPQFEPAVAALARVYTLTGHEAQATALIQAQNEQVGQNPQVLDALGESLYRQGLYNQAIVQLQQSIANGPGSALAYATLARAALDANRLNDAIVAAQKAVQLAPTVGQFHATLGLVYTYCNFTDQAQREFETALAFDPQNALALVELGLLSQQGDPRTTIRTQELASAQGFMSDPAIARDLVRPGVKTEATAAGGPRNYDGSLTHRDEALDGRLNFYGNIIQSKDNGNETNSDYKSTEIRADTTMAFRPGTTGYFHVLHGTIDSGLPGTTTPDSASSSDDRDESHFDEGILALRQKIKSSSLWAGIYASDSRDYRSNPNQDYSLAGSFSVPFQTDFPSFNYRNETTAVSPELRWDLPLGNTGLDQGLFTVGIARPYDRQELSQNLLVTPAFPGGMAGFGNSDQSENEPTTMAYTQLSKRLSPRSSFVVELRRERTDQTTVLNGQTTSFLPFGPPGPSVTSLSTPPVQSTSTMLLPSLVANYQATKSILLRLSASRRTTDITESIFAPNDTLLTTEQQALPLGIASPSDNGDMHVYELDAERYLSKGSLLKIYAFQSSARNLIYDFSQFADPSDPTGLQGFASNNFMAFNRVDRYGLGTRYERQLGSSLFGATNLSVNRTTAEANEMSPNFLAVVPAPFNGQTAPYYPKYIGQFDLNYISDKGNKVNLSLLESGRIFDDTNDPDLARPSSRSTTSINLRLAREPSVHNEFFLQFTNLLNEDQILYNGIPVNPRRTTVGWTHRF